MTTTGDKFVIAIDLGGTSLRVAKVTLDGKVSQRLSVPTGAHEGVEAVINRMVATVAEVADYECLQQAAALVVAAPGPLDPWGGIVVEPPNLPGWERIPLKQILETRLNVTTFLGNDANIAALGEHRFGVGQGTKHMIYVTVSTGIGGGIIIDGKLLLGKNGGAGEVGHMTIDMNGPKCPCGNIGCLEAIASGTSIARQSVERLRAGAQSSISGVVGGDLTLITGQTVVQEARKGDPLAKDIMALAAAALGAGMVNLVNLFDPEVIAIGGGVSNAGPLLFEPVRQIVNDRAMSIARKGLKIVPTALGDDVGLLGAAALALEELQIAV